MEKQKKAVTPDGGKPEISEIAESYNPSGGDGYRDGMKAMLN